MDVLTDLTITVSVDTASARQEVADFQQYALGVLEEVRAAYAALSAQVQADDQTFSDGWGLSFDVPDITRRA